MFWYFLFIAHLFIHLLWFCDTVHYSCFFVIIKDLYVNHSRVIPVSPIKIEDTRKLCLNYVIVVILKSVAKKQWKDCTIIL